MTREVSLGSAAAFSDPGRLLVDIDGVEIAVFRHRGEFSAFLNLCPHLGGPACSGKILPLAIEAVGEGGHGLGRMHAKDEFNVVCPWHGYEFNIRTGEHPTMKRVKLRPVPVRVENGEVFVAVPAARSAGLQEASLSRLQQILPRQVRHDPENFAAAVRKLPTNPLLSPLNLFQYKGMARALRLVLASPWHVPARSSPADEASAASVQWTQRNHANIWRFCSLEE